MTAATATSTAAVGFHVMDFLETSNERVMALQLDVQSLTTQTYDALHDVVSCAHRPSSTGERMKRVMIVDALCQTDAALAQHVILQGGMYVDPKSRLEAILTSVLSRHYHRPDFSIGPSMAETVQQYQSLRRIIAEVRVIFQPLETAGGCGYVERFVMRLVTEFIASLPDYGSQQIILSSFFSELSSIRELWDRYFLKGDATAKPAVDAVVNQARECIAFAMELIPPRERPRVSAQLLREPYIAKMRADRTLWCGEGLTKGVASPFDFVVSMDAVFRSEVALVRALLPNDKDVHHTIKRLLQDSIFGTPSLRVFLEPLRIGGISDALNTDDSRMVDVLLSVWDFEPATISFFCDGFRKWVEAHVPRPPMSHVVKAPPSPAHDDADDTGELATLERFHHKMRRFVMRVTDATKQPMLFAALHAGLACCVDGQLLAAGLVKAIDRCIRNVSQRSTEGTHSRSAEQEEVWAALDGHCAMMVLLSGFGDFFAECYKHKLLQRRQLSPHPPSTALELAVLRRIIASSGWAQHLSEVAAMISELKHHHFCVHEPDGGVHGGGIRRSITLLSSLIAPQKLSLTDGENSSAPCILLDAIRSHKTPHESSTAAGIQHVLDWGLSAAELKLSVGADVCRVYGSLEQLRVLLCVQSNSSRFHSIPDIANHCRLTTNAVFCVLSTLLASGAVEHCMPLDTRDPSITASSTITSLSTFRFRTAFVTDRRGKRVALAPALPASVGSLIRPAVVCPTEMSGSPVPPLVLTPMQVVNELATCKEKGSTLYREARYAEAVQLWDEGLQQLDALRVHLPDSTLGWRKDIALMRAAVLSNLMMALVKLQTPKRVPALAADVLTDEYVENSLKAKVLYRRALAFEQMGRLREALDDLNHFLLKLNTDPVVAAKRREVQDKLKASDSQ